MKDGVKREESERREREGWVKREESERRESEEWGEERRE